MQNDYLISFSKSRGFAFSVMVLLYYSSSFLVIIAQDLPRYEWFRDLHLLISEEDIIRFTLVPYPFLRAIQFGLLLHLITLFPIGVTPRHALPRWLRFRLGWRPPTKNWRYRVLPPHLVG